MKHFAGIARASLRKVDFIGRLGGGEFAVFLPGSDTNGALETAERLRQAVAQRPVPTCSGNIALTVSVGVATVSIADLSPDSVLARADAALLRSEIGRPQPRRVHRGNRPRAVACLKVGQQPLRLEGLTAARGRPDFTGRTAGSPGCSLQM